jgi:hypothetical protein
VYGVCVTNNNGFRVTLVDLLDTQKSQLQIIMTL